MKKELKTVEPEEDFVKTQHGVFHVHDIVDCDGWDYDYCGEIRGFAGTQAEVYWSDDGISQMVNIDDLRPTGKRADPRPLDFGIIVKSSDGKFGTVRDFTLDGTKLFVRYQSTGKFHWVKRSDWSIFVQKGPVKNKASMFNPYEIIKHKGTGELGCIRQVDKTHNEVEVYLESEGIIWIDPDDIELWRGDEPRKD